jgi:hypothetical protein
VAAAALEVVISVLEFAVLNNTSVVLVVIVQCYFVFCSPATPITMQGEAATGV